MAYVPPYPLLNRTYNLYRLSPLHHGDNTPLLTDQSVRAHAKRLKEQLKGDNVRGVQVDFASADETAKLGPLQECRWEVLGDENAWIDRRLQSEDPGAPRVAPDVTPDFTCRFLHRIHSVLVTRPQIEDPRKSSPH